MDPRFLHHGVMYVLNAALLFTTYSQPGFSLESNNHSEMTADSHTTHYQTAPTLPPVSSQTQRVTAQKWEFCTLPMPLCQTWLSAGNSMDSGDPCPFFRTNMVRGSLTLSSKDKYCESAAHLF